MTTVKASFATIISVYLTPFFAHSAASVDLIGRDAFEISVSPLQKREKPPPVPEMPTVI